MVSTQTPGSDHQATPPAGTPDRPGRSRPHHDPRGPAHRTSAHRTSAHRTSSRHTWRVVDIVVAAVVAVASGVVFWAWNLAYAGLGGVFLAFPPSSGLVAGMWLFPAVLGALLIRRPGAALFTELVAAAVSALLGSQFGLTVLASGLVQGIGAELVFLLFLYRRFTLPVALLAGAAAGVACGLNEAFLFAWFPEYTLAWKWLYVGFTGISGIVIAGLLSWLATRALAATGALAALPSRGAHREPAGRG